MRDAGSLLLCALDLSRVQLCWCFFSLVVVVCLSALSRSGTAAAAVVEWYARVRVRSSLRFMRATASGLFAGGGFGEGVARAIE